MIDVPGHERYIRNMVAGAWSLDCALLLVAADDGWMQQTQDHAVVPLEGGIFYAKETYDGIASEILAGRKPGDTFSIPEAKERTGLSRKYMLPLLNRLEKDGRLKREGDARVVL